jgi:GNAT superfamily N-acetyltransferase
MARPMKVARPGGITSVQHDPRGKSSRQISCLLVTDIDIRPMRYGAPVVRTLVAAAMADLGARYGGAGDETPVQTIEFDPPNGLFLLAWRDGAAVGCAGWRSHGQSDELAELKRLYVDPAARRTGVAVALLEAVQDAARLAGRTRMVLECGAQQPEAIALYEKNGFTRIDDFGFYQGYPDVRSYGRDL